MNIFFLMNVRFPTEKAHGQQIAKMCEAYTELGHRVVLVLPKRINPITQDPCEYYGLRTPIETVLLPVIDLLWSRWIPRRLAFVLMEVSFLFFAKRWVRRQTDASALVITRDQFLAPRLRKRGWMIAFEGHDMADDFLKRHPKLGRNVDLVIMTNTWKAEEARRVWGNTRARLVVAPNAIDVAPFQALPSREEAKRALGWDLNKRACVYVGHLYAWKGVYTLADASRFLPASFEAVCVGGTKEDFVAMEAYAREHHLDTLRLIQHVPPGRVPLYLAAADCLVLPNSGTSFQAKYTTSPIKLWEYLAARRPVVASDLPSLRELVDDACVRFVAPDSPAELAQALVEASAGDDSRVERGYALALANDWKRRAQRILEAAYPV